MQINAKQNGYQFRNHTIKLISTICLALGCMSIILPLFYHVTPVSGVIFTIVAGLAYYLISFKNAATSAAFILTIILITSSLAFSIIHGVYGSLGYFLMFFAAIVSGMIWSIGIGIAEFLLLTAANIPLALQQSSDREIFAGTPMLPDLLMALFIATATLGMLHVLSKKVAQMSATETTYQRRITAYDSKFEKISKDKLKGLENELTERTKRLQLLAERGKELSRLGHDAGNILTQLRLTIDQQSINFDKKDRDAIEGSFEKLNNLLKNSNHGKGSKRSNPKESLDSALSVLSKLISETSCRIQLNVEESICSIPPNELERVLINIIKNSIESFISTRKPIIKIVGKNIKRNYVLTIKDNGCGIDHQITPLITEAWFSTKGEEHSGLGLASVEEILMRHHGEMQIKTQSRGTLVKIKLRTNV